MHTSYPIRFPVKTPSEPVAAPHPLDDGLHRQWLVYGSKYDIQTGLLNPHWFQRWAETLVRDLDPAKDGLAFLWIDVLNLRKGFSVWGWSGADALVSHIAGILRSQLDEDALISRFSRCFVVCMRGSKNDPEMRCRMQELLDAIAEPVADFGITPEIAAGVAFYPDDAVAAEDLARHASLASDLAAQKGARTVLPFHRGMNKQMMRDHELEKEFEKALDSDCIDIFYQAKVDLTTGEAHEAEALMRWTHPIWGEIPPSEIIPIAERSSLIYRVFEVSLRTALRDAQGWNTLGIAPSVISVNISPAVLRREDIARRVRDIMAEFPIAPVQLELEVMESLLLDDEKLFTARIRQLKAIGVRVAIDDFGTRYTGFDLLSRLPIDSLKIDRCFIRGIHRSADRRALCNTIVAMGRQMRMRTVAEGIEEEEELEALRQMGCDAGQGFLLQRPGSANEFATFLQDWPQNRGDFGFAPGGERAGMRPLCRIS